MWLTIISIVFTIVSVVFSIISIYNAKKAKDYKDDARRVLNTIDLKGFISDFERISKDFINKTRDKNWYKGQDPNIVIRPLSDILMQFGSIYPHINNSEELKTKVHTLSSKILKYETVTQKEKAQTHIIICEIVEFLYSSINILIKQI